MKYFDRNTVKTISNWQNKQSDSKKSDYRSKNQLKRAVREFSYKVSDKLWWNSLNSGEQSSVYGEYMGWNTWYSYSGPTPTSYSQMLPYIGYDILVGSALSEKLAEVSEEEHNERMEFLMDKYNNPNKRRELVIREILNFE